MHHLYFGKLCMVILPRRWNGTCCGSDSLFYFKWCDLQQFTDGTIFRMGLSQLGVYQLIFAMIVLLIVDIIHERYCEPA